MYAVEVEVLQDIMLEVAESTRGIDTARNRRHFPQQGRGGSKSGGGGGVCVS